MPGHLDLALIEARQGKGCLEPCSWDGSSIGDGNDQMRSRHEHVKSGFKRDFPSDLPTAVTHESVGEAACLSRHARHVSAVYYEHGSSRVRRATSTHIGKTRPCSWPRWRSFVDPPNPRGGRNIRLSRLGCMQLLPVPRWRLEDPIPAYRGSVRGLKTLKRWISTVMEWHRMRTC